MSRLSSSPARRHFEAMHRLLTLGIALLILFTAFQIGGIAPVTAKADRTATISLDLSTSASRQTIDRRYGAVVAGQSN